MIQIFVVFCFAHSQTFQSFSLDILAGWVAGVVGPSPQNVVYSSDYHINNIPKSRRYSAFCQLQNKDEIFIFSSAHFGYPYHLNDLWFFSSSRNSFQYKRGHLVDPGSGDSHSRLPASDFNPSNDPSGRKGSSCVAISENVHTL